MVSLAVAALVSAPAAGARPGTCRDVGLGADASTTTCETTGNVSIKATPGDVGSMEPFTAPTPYEGAAPTCQDGGQSGTQDGGHGGVTSTCQTDGDSSIKATPGEITPYH